MMPGDAVSAVPEMSSNFLLSVFQIRLLSLSSLTTTHFLDRKGINLRVDDCSSKEATSEFISKAKAILYGGGAQTAGNS